MWKAQNVDVFLMFNAGKISDARVLSRFNNPFLIYGNKVANVYCFIWLLCLESFYVIWSFSLSHRLKPKCFKRNTEE